MSWIDYRQDLIEGIKNVEQILDQYFHCGTSAVFAEASAEEEPELKGQVADRLLTSFRVRVHPLQIVICGSAHLGFSPSPTKLGRPFNPAKSDIDLAVISSELFDLWWAELQSVKLSDLSEPVRRRLPDNLFYGFINPANTLDIATYGQKWWRIFGELRTNRAKAIRGRLYRNFWTMENYHRKAVEFARDLLR